MYLLFDLDGTLTNSQLGITRSVAYALGKVKGITIDDLSTLTSYIGPPLVNGFMENHGFSLEDAKECVKAYRERYEQKGLFELTVYDGVCQMIENLYKSGFKLVVATSKPEVFAKKIIQNIGLEKYFETICGATLDGKIDTKDEVIAEVKLRLKSLSVNDCFMIGDRKHDVLGAKHHNIKTLGALWGFGSKNELEQAGAYKLFEKPKDIERWFIK